MCFFIGKLLGVVAAAIKGNVDREYYISHERFSQFRHSPSVSTVSQLPVSTENR
jgi:hypothetical protein